MKEIFSAPVKVRSHAILKEGSELLWYSEKYKSNSVAATVGEWKSEASKIYILVSKWL